MPVRNTWGCLLLPVVRLLQEWSSVAVRNHCYCCYQDERPLQYGTSVTGRLLQHGAAATTATRLWFDSTAAASVGVLLWSDTLLQWAVLQPVIPALLCCGPVSRWSSLVPASTTQEGGALF